MANSMRCSTRSPANSRPSSSPSSPKKRRDAHLTVGQALGASGLEAREARLLLAHASGFSGAALVAFPERSLSEEAAARFAPFAERRRRGEPVAYIVREKEFYGLRLPGQPAVLLPPAGTQPPG